MYISTTLSWTATSLILKELSCNICVMVAFLHTHFIVFFPFIKYRITAELRCYWIFIPVNFCHIWCAIRNIPYLYSYKVRSTSDTGFKHPDFWNSVSALTPQYYLLWGPPKNGVKSRKHSLHGHLAGTAHKVCKIAEEAKCRNIEPEFYYICMPFLKAFKLIN
jgi:hypothetical protein